MTILIWLLSLAVSFSAFTKSRDLIHSVGFSLNTVSSESELQDADQKRVLTFKPNVATGFGIAAETEHFGIAYTFAGKEAQSINHEKTKYRDLRLNFHYKNFDFRLMLQKYRGALVETGGRSKFYKDYEVRSQNGRIHYYIVRDYLNYIRDGRKLVNKAAQNEGSQFIGSWFFGVNLDSRRIELPDNLEPEHQAIVSRKINQYDRSFSAFSMGPLVGYDGMFQWNSAFVRGKFAGGPAFQTGGGTVPQFEIGFNTGVVLNEKHLVSIWADIYNLNFKDSDQRISNTNAHVSVAYTYAFN
ncbi:MAG: hypothetical protein ACLGHN_09180 [Bacteriovoracia bacterium]